MLTDGVPPGRMPRITEQVRLNSIVVMQFDWFRIIKSSRRYHHIMYDHVYKSEWKRWRRKLKKIWVDCERKEKKKIIARWLIGIGRRKRILLTLSTIGQEQEHYDLDNARYIQTNKHPY